MLHHTNYLKNHLEKFVTIKVSPMVISFLPFCIYLNWISIINLYLTVIFVLSTWDRSVNKATFIIEISSIYIRLLNLGKKWNKTDKTYYMKVLTGILIFCFGISLSNLSEIVSKQLCHNFIIVVRKKNRSRISWQNFLTKRENLI